MKWLKRVWKKLRILMVWQWPSLINPWCRWFKRKLWCLTRYFSEIFTKFMERLKSHSFSHREIKREIFVANIQVIGAYILHVCFSIDHILFRLPYHINPCVLILTIFILRNGLKTTQKLRRGDFYQLVMTMRLSLPAKEGRRRKRITRKSPRRETPQVLLLVGNPCLLMIILKRRSPKKAKCNLWRKFKCFWDRWIFSSTKFKTVSSWNSKKRATTFSNCCCKTLYLDTMHVLCPPTPSRSIWSS